MSGVEIIIIAAASLIIVIGGVIKTIYKLNCCGMQCERNVTQNDTQTTSFMQSVINKLTPRRNKTPRANKAQETSQEPSIEVVTY